MEAGGGKKGAEGGYGKSNRRGVAGERKGEERKEGGGNRECHFFKICISCPYMEKWGDCKFEHGGEKGGKYGVREVEFGRPLWVSMILAERSGAPSRQQGKGTRWGGAREK